MPIGYGIDPSTDPAAAGMVPMNAGGAGLGALIGALTGRKRNAAMAEQRGRQDALKSLLVEAQAYGEREQARRTYAENQGLDGLEAALTPTLGPQMAHAAAQAARAKYNLHEASQAALDTQGMDYRREAHDALARGDFRGGNAALAAVDGKPLQTTSEAGGTLFNQYDLPGQAIHTTAVGQADIGAKVAQAAASYASAEDNRASAGEHRARTADIRSGGSGDGKPTPLNLDGSLKILEAPQVVNGRPVTNPLTGAPAMAIDPTRLGKAMQFITAYRGGHPRATGDEALAHFVGGGEQQMAAVLEQKANQALSEARAVVRSGRLTRAQAQARLRQGGFADVADQL